MDGVPIRLGTRGSALALVQARWVAAALVAADIPAELVTVTTAGDVRAPDTAWGEGAFVGAIEAALLEGRVDAAVHSAKDVPTIEDPRLVIAAFTVREDARDALVCRVRGTTLATLPLGARVGTDSPRRTAFLRAIRPDLTVHPLSGNVDTRLRKLDAGESDALVLAVAGLTRLGHADRIDEILPLEVAVPAPGQGALALQARAGDERTRTALATLDDPATRVAVEAERLFLRATGGGCRSPIGCFGRVVDGELELHAAARRGLEGEAPSAILTAATAASPTVASPAVVRLASRGPVADHLAQAQALAAGIVSARRPRVLVTRPAGGAGPLADALRGRGLEPVFVPTIAIRDAAPGGPLDERAIALGDYAWTVVTSGNGARALADAVARTAADPASTRWAAVGEGTAATLAARGIATSFQPSRALGAALGAELPVEPGMRVLLARGDLADPALATDLGRRGVVVEEVVAYETVEGPATSAAPLTAALGDGPFDVLLFGSGSAVRGLLALAPPALRDELRGAVAVCIGPVTGGVARDHGFSRVVEASTPGPEALAEAALSAILAPPVDGSGSPHAHIDDKTRSRHGAATTTRESR